MCTLVFAWQVFDDAPLVIAANREEALDRPSEPPRVRRWGARLLAPRDQQAGGTWIGYTEHGVFVAITNRHVDLEGERSRGKLVTDVLEQPTATAGVETVRAAVARDRYAGFNLAVVDAKTATILEWDGQLEEQALNPGVHVVTNGGPDGRDEKARHVRERVLESATTGDDDMDAAIASASPAAFLGNATAALVDHDLGTCRHEDGYGTRSSSLIAVHSSGRVEYWFADGPPCETEHRRVFDGLL